MRSRQGEAPTLELPATPVDVPAQPDHTMRDIGKIFAYGGLATAVVIGGGYGAQEVWGSDGSAKTEEPRHLGSDAAIETCDDSSFSAESANAKKYTSDAFLPKGTLRNNDDVEKYTKGLFDKDGPLGKKIDPASLAAVYSAIVKPSHDGAATNPDYDYLGEFGSALAAYNADEGGLARAEEDCQVAMDTLQQVAQYDGNWAQNGETVTQIIAFRGDDNKIITMKLEKVVTGETLSGIDLELRGSNDGIDGFNKALITAEGDLYLKGVTNGVGGSVSLEKAAKGPSSEDADKNGRSDKAATNNGGGSKNKGKNQGDTGEGGSAGPNGDNPEAGPGGVTNSPGEGGETTSTTGKPGTTTTTTTKPSVTTTTAPPTTTTTKPPVTTTTTAPTTTTTQRDVCPNIPGAQPTVPPGMEIRDGICKEIPPADGGGF